jgi:hypothetical protein
MTTHPDTYVVDFQVLAFGLVYASVCTSHDEAETTRLLNLVHPTGLHHGWTPSTDETFATGQPNPCECELSPKTHHHVLYWC